MPKKRQRRRTTTTRVSRRRRRRTQKGGNAPMTAAKIAEKVVRKLIPSTNHVFKSYWDGSMAKSAFGRDRGILSKKFWTRPKKGTRIRLVKGSDGKYHNVYVEP